MAIEIGAPINSNAIKTTAIIKPHTKTVFITYASFTHFLSV